MKTRGILGMLQEIDSVQATLLVLSWVVIMAAGIAMHSIDSTVSLIAWSLVGFLASDLLMEGLVKLACALLDRV